MTHGETFLGSRDGQILLSVGAANWQIVAKSRLKGINVWRKKYCLWHTRLVSKCSVIDSVHQKHASVTKWPVSLFSSRIDNSNTHKYAGLAPVCLCVCKSIKIQQNPPDIQSVLVTMTTPAPKRQSASDEKKQGRTQNKRLNWCCSSNKMRMDVRRVCLQKRWNM